MARDEVNKVDKKAIEDIFTRLFSVISDMRTELCFENPDGFDKYLEDMVILTKPLEMKIYCYKEGDEIPEDAKGIFRYTYKETDKPDLNEKVCTTGLIGFRSNKLDIRSSGEVTLYKFDSAYKSAPDPSVSPPQEAHTVVDKSPDVAKGEPPSTPQESLNMDDGESFSRLQYSELRALEKLRGITHFDEKTSDFVLKSAESLVFKYPEKVNLCIVTNLKEYYNGGTRYDGDKLNKFKKLEKEIMKNSKKVKK